MAKKPYIEDELLPKIAAKIKQLRISAGYTSYENFALEKDIDRKQYWRLKKGVNITVTTLMKILNIHKISFREFFEGME